jgi:RNA polymerase sigma-70 factor (ECF subfamily)
MSDHLKTEFLEILANYQGIVHKVNLIYFRNEADRCDNFQEVVLQLWKSFPRLKNKNSIGSWIYRIAINTSITKIKKERNIVLNDSIPDLRTDSSALEMMMANEAEKQLMTAIHQLNAIDKAIMLLYLEEKSYDEIAEVIGITVSNVGARISRAKERLKQTIKKLNHEK